MNQPYRQIHGETVHTFLENGLATVVDVREPNEYAEGHIPGAVNIPLGSFPEEVENRYPDKSRPVIVYCHSGFRSRRAALALIDSGYQDVEDLGPLSAWNRPLEMGDGR